MHCKSCSLLQQHSINNPWHVRQHTACVGPAVTAAHTHLPLTACAAAAAPQQPASPYNSGGDEHAQKATLDHIFSPDAAAHFRPGSASASAVDEVQSPWSVGWQMNERNLVWNDDLKLRLIQRIASQELQLSEGELRERLSSLTVLLPDLAPRLGKAPPHQVAQLAANTHTLAARLLRLRSIFPQANTSALVCRRLSLLLDEDLEAVAAARERLRQLLPRLCVDRFVEAHPQVLDVADFEAALADAKRLMPQLDVFKALASDPELVLSFQKGQHLIPYDEPWPIKKSS